jgi:hypothetical protein
MFAQRARLIELLDKHGWEVVERKNVANHWIVDQWLIKSTWTPTDCHVYLTFEIDPQLLPKDSQDVWGIAAGLYKPQDCFIEYLPEVQVIVESRNPVYLHTGRRWEKYLPEFFGGLAELRTLFSFVKKQ